MQEARLTEPQPIGFLHRCRKCRRQYKLRLRIDLLQVYRNICPHCENASRFDNRDGRLRFYAARRANVNAPPLLPPVEPKSEAHAILSDKTSPDLQGGQSDRRRRTFPDRVRSEVDAFRRHWSQPRSFRAVLYFTSRAIILGMLAVVTLFVSVHIPYVYFANPDEYVARMQSVEPNLIFDKSGVLLVELFARKTGSLKGPDIPDTLKRKLVFVEDQNFYTHGGIDWPSVLRALSKNTSSLGYAQGASTLTQQLARTLLADQKKTIFRKLREAALAYHLERRFTKEEIITAYMNHVYLGHGANGMDVAAQFYFGKDLDKLNFTEELILVSLPSAPERFSPIKNTDALERKLDVIHARMIAEHFTDVSRDDFQAEKRLVLASLNRSPKDSVFASRLNNAPFLAEYVRQKIKDILGDKYEYSAGLRIETTVDARLQQAAGDQSKDFIQTAAQKFPPVRILDKRYAGEGSLADQIAEEYMSVALGGVLLGLPESQRTLPRLQAASIGVDPATGAVLFMQGGMDFSSGNQLNRAIAMRRQTGSAIKPIIYSAGIESGAINTATPLDDTPIYAAKTMHKSTDKPYWMPENMSGIYEGSIPARKALVHSKNIPAIRVARKTGLERVGEQFKKFFFPDPKVFEKRFRSDDTVAIGSLEMSPLEMASAFSAFGNNGVIKRPFLIKSIKDRNGKELYKADRDEFDLHVPDERKVLSGDVAEVMGSMLLQSGGTKYESSGGYFGPVMGKTGTTNDSKDVWFVGVTPGLSMAVWVGYDDPAFSMPGAIGSDLARPLWGRIASEGGITGAGFFNFSPHATYARICRDSGKWPRPGCPELVDEIFALDHLPGGMCDRHTEQRRVVGATESSLSQDSDFN